MQEHGADIHLRSGEDGGEGTALSAAIVKGHTDVVQLLLQLGGPVDYIDERIGANTKRIFVVAAEKDHDSVKLLAEYSTEEAPEDESNVLLERPENSEAWTWLESVQKRRWMKN